MTKQDPIFEARRQWVAHGWGDAADGMAMVTSIMRAQQILMERIDAELRPLGLTFARFEVLRLLAFARSNRMRMTRLGSLLQVHPTSVTSAVERLVRQGYVERQRLDKDRRVVLAAITPSGRRIVEEATERLNARVFGAPGLSDVEVGELTDLLARLRASGEAVTPAGE